MNYFLLFPFLLINFCYLTNGEKATVAQCETIVDYYVIKDDCVCTNDFSKCLTSIVNQGKCTKEDFPANLTETTLCTKMYSKCSLTENECDICGCFE
ncbi:unnamed protein product [Meloidogyne enterolobii]|uniref:Uncharacterized protein n=1 Tax=Meloidogyne enterolobii TaxID=390850 RepID=A0ACB1AAN6_MELEN